MRVQNELQRVVAALTIARKTMRNLLDAPLLDEDREDLAPIQKDLSNANDKLEEYFIQRGFI